MALDAENLEGPTTLHSTTRMIQRRHLLLSAAATTIGLATPVRAQSFPSRPVRIVMPFAAGNTQEVILRVVGQEFQRSTGQPFVLDARPGAGGIIAAQSVSQAAPDGHTLLLATSAMMAIYPHFNRPLPYDPFKSFRHVTACSGTAVTLVVNADVPVSDLAGFLAWARTNPGKVSYASFAPGGMPHFVGVMLNKRAGTDMVHVPFNGTPPVVTAMLGGHVQAAYLPALPVQQHIAAGKFKALATTGGKRSPVLPNVPTFAELGYPELERYGWSGFSAPAGTPDAIVDRLQVELVRAMATPEAQEQWRLNDLVALPMKPAEFDALIRRDSAIWAEAVRVSGFKGND